MTIYIEYAIIDNLIINFILLFLTSKVFKEKVSKLKLLSASLLGMLCAIIFPAINSNAILLLILKILLGFSMCLICYSGKFKQMCFKFLTFLGLTFALGGSIYGVFLSLGIPFNALLLGGYNSIVPVSIFILLIFAFYLTCIKLLKLLKKNKFIYKVTVKNKDLKLNLTAFYDSGNGLKDRDGKPICIISEGIYKKLKAYKNPRFVNLRTVSSGSSEIFVFDVDELEIESKKLKDIAVGVSNVSLGKFDILLNNSIT